MSRENTRDEDRDQDDIEDEEIDKDIEDEDADSDNDSEDVDMDDEWEYGPISLPCPILSWKKVDGKPRVKLTAEDIAQYKLNPESLVQGQIFVSSSADFLDEEDTNDKGEGAFRVHAMVVINGRKNKMSKVFYLTVAGEGYHHGPGGRCEAYGYSKDAIWEFLAESERVVA